MKKLLSVLGVIAVIGACIWAGSYWFNSRKAAANNAAQNTPANSYLISFDNSSESGVINIKNSRGVLKAIAPKDVPSFDTNEGVPADPANDYRLDFNPILDSLHGVVYFSAYNRTTAGNANADRALFAYDIKKDTMTLLKKEEMSVSFGTLTISGDGNYLVYSDGSHGGLCYNTLGLGVYDLKKSQEIASISLSTSTVGIIEFDHWTDNSSFTYTEETFTSEKDCLDEFGESPQIINKTYHI